jgi:hypothetical protein
MAAADEAVRAKAGVRRKRGREGADNGPQGGGSGASDDRLCDGLALQTRGPSQGAWSYRCAKGPFTGEPS